MFLQQSAYRPNYNYSHPLAGTFYNNSHFVSRCSSYLDSEIKLSTTTS